MEKHLSGLGERFSSPEEEIAFLRGRIADTEKELLGKNYEISKETIVAEEISKYRGLLPEQVLHETAQLAEHDIESIVLNLTPEKHDSKIEQLIDLARRKGVKNALSVLSALRDPHLEDDFHKFLVQYVAQGYTFPQVKTNKPEYRGLDIVLYEVVLLEEKDRHGNADVKKSLKELISGMEQFLAGMMSVDQKNSRGSYVVFEIANPNGSDQFIFYVGVPRQYCELFEKQIISILGTVRLSEVVDDYNIFNEDGVSVGSYLTLKESPVYPFKTYEVFDVDPLNVILNSFSKIQKQGEGAAIQLVFAPQGDYFHKKYGYVIEQLEKGVPTKEAIHVPEGILGSFKKTLSGLFFASAPEDEKEKKIDTEAIEKIKRKISTPIVATNVRMIVSAKSRPDAERILGTIESGFNQFTDTTSNAIVPHRLENNQLRKMFRDFSFRTYNPDHLVPLNLREISTLVHFQTHSLAPTPQLKQTQATTAPAPSTMGTTGTVLGVNTYRNVDTTIYMRDEDRLRHMYTIGQTGTGKTTLMKNMIIQDIQAGNGVCFIDPHGMDILDVLANIPVERFSDVIYFDPSHTERPMALNMLEYDHRYPEQKTFVVNEMLAIFNKLFDMKVAGGPMFEQYFRNATMLVVEDPGSGCTLLDVSRVLADKAFRQAKLAQCKNPIVVQFWNEVAEKAGGEASLANIIPYITSKFDVFMANDIMRPIIAQERSSFNFRDIMDNKKILLVNLAKGRLGDINANLIGLILVGKILMAALSRADAVGSDFPPFYLYIDEFQNITTDSISTILSEARKYKLSLSIAHQFIAQLDEKIRDAVFGNVGSIVSFRVGAEDAEFLEKQFSPEFSAKDIMNIDNYNAYAKILVEGKPVKAFNIKTFPSPKGESVIVDTLKQLSYLTYGGDRDEIEAEIAQKYKKN